MSPLSGKIGMMWEYGMAASKRGVLLQEVGHGELDDLRFHLWNFWMDLLIWAQNLR